MLVGLLPVPVLRLSVRPLVMGKLSALPVMLHIWRYLPLVVRSEDVQRVRVGVRRCPDDLRGLVVQIVPRFVSYFFVINSPKIKIVRLSALVAFPVARSEPIFLSFSGNSFLVSSGGVMFSR